jgi:hypothetical protein
MKQTVSHEDLLRQVLDRVIENNRQIRQGTPMADLKQAIEEAIQSLPKLEFEEINKAVEDTNAAEQLIQKSPQLLGWDADHLVEWIEELSKKI